MFQYLTDSTIIKPLTLATWDLTAADPDQLDALTATALREDTDVIMLSGLRHPIEMRAAASLRRHTTKHHWQLTDALPPAERCALQGAIMTLGEPRRGPEDLAIIVRSRVFQGVPETHETRLTQAFANPLFAQLTLGAPYLRLVVAQTAGARQTRRLRQELTTAGRSPLLAFTNHSVHVPGYQNTGHLLWRGMSVTNLDPTPRRGIPHTRLTLQVPNVGRVLDPESTPDQIILWNIGFSTRH